MRGFVIIEDRNGQRYLTAPVLKLLLGCVAKYQRNEVGKNQHLILVNLNKEGFVKRNLHRCFLSPPGYAPGGDCVKRNLRSYEPKCALHISAINNASQETSAPQVYMEVR